MPTATIRPFEPSPEAYRALTALWNQSHPEWPRYAQVWQQIDADAEGLVHFVAMESGHLVGGADAARSTGSAVPGAFSVSLYVEPSREADTHLLGALHDALLRALADGAARVLFAYVADSRPELVSFYEAAGYTRVQGSAFSRLEVERYEDAQHARAAQEVLDAGYEIVSVRDVAGRDPEWKRHYWALHCDILADVPFEGGFQPPSYEAFAEKLEAMEPEARDACFLVCIDGTYVGESRLKLMPEVSGGAFAELTGTVRAHRRRGLATALKRAAILHARAAGYPFITALNEVDNPMLQLNLALGFETQYVQYTLCRDLM